MKILNARVDYCEQYDNPPRLQILVDKIPEDLVYTDKHPYYFGEKDGYVNFYYYDERDKTGFGGSSYNIKTNKGKKTLVGPWSSNSLTMYAAGFPISYNVAMAEEKEVFERGYTFYAGNITEELFKEAIEKFCPEYHYVTIKEDLPFSPNCSDEQNAVIGSLGQNTINYLQIAKRDMSFEQSQSFKRAICSLKIIKNWNDKGKSYFQTQEEWNNLLQEHKNHYNKLVNKYCLEKFGLKVI